MIEINLYFSQIFFQFHRSNSKLSWALDEFWNLWGRLWQTRFRGDKFTRGERFECPVYFQAFAAAFHAWLSLIICQTLLNPNKFELFFRETLFFGGRGDRSEGGRGERFVYPAYFQAFAVAFHACLSLIICQTCYVSPHHSILMCQVENNGFSQLC